MLLKRFFAWLTGPSAAERRHQEILLELRRCADAAERLERMSKMLMLGQGYVLTKSV